MLVNAATATLARIKTDEREARSRVLLSEWAVWASLSLFTYDSVGEKVADIFSLLNQKGQKHSELSTWGPASDSGC